MNEQECQVGSIVSIFLWGLLTFKVDKIFEVMSG